MKLNIQVSLLTLAITGLTPVWAGGVLPGENGPAIANPQNTAVPQPTTVNNPAVVTNPVLPARDEGPEVDTTERIDKRLSAMIEPAMILVIGGMVGFVYYAFFQALFALAGGGG